MNPVTETRAYVTSMSFWLKEGFTVVIKGFAKLRTSTSGGTSFRRTIILRPTLPHAGHVRSCFASVLNWYFLSRSGRASASVTLGVFGKTGTAVTCSFVPRSRPAYASSGAGVSFPHAAQQMSTLAGTQVDWNALSIAPFSSARSEMRSCRNSDESDGLYMSLRSASPTSPRNAVALASSFVSTNRRSARSRGPPASVAGHATFTALCMACSAALT